MIMNYKIQQARSDMKKLKPNTTQRTFSAKLLTLIFCFLLPAGGQIFAQGCLPAGIIFSRQSQIDSFPINYPGCTEIEGEVVIEGGDISSLNGLNQVVRFLNSLTISNCSHLENLDGLQNLEVVGRNLSFLELDALETLTGAGNLKKITAQLKIESCPALINLSGLNSLDSAGRLSVQNNLSLVTLKGLESLQQIDNEIIIMDNPSLGFCSIEAICDKLDGSFTLLIGNNSTGCNTRTEIIEVCNQKPVIVKVAADMDSNCISDAGDMLLEGIQVHYQTNTKSFVIPTDQNGIVEFGFSESGLIRFTLPQFPTQNWGMCTDTIWIDTDTLMTDTIFANFLLESLRNCPDPIVELELPPFFRACQFRSDIRVIARNIGATTAENVVVVVAFPPQLELISASPTFTGQSGDSYFFEVGNLTPFGFVNIDMTVKTKCDSFLLNRTLCLEAFADLDNPCPDNPKSEIRLSGQCDGLGNAKFTLRNVGTEPTQGKHEYVIIEDEIVLRVGTFSLEPDQEMSIEEPANGATIRMEATKYPDGTNTARAVENCSGLNPGLVTQFWLEDGQDAYDYDCREVRLAYDPNQKTAIPTGVGEAHLLPQNRVIDYYIEFQNTGNDTAVQVILEDVLSGRLDISTFRPGFSSHDYSWQIRGDTLEVVFDQIMLPDSHVNVEASKGFFSFQINQKNDLPAGSVIENTAQIYFDNNPPILTNLVFHTIGKLWVKTDEIRNGLKMWRLKGNPTKTTAVFETTEFIPGIKIFELTNAFGHKIRYEKFYEQHYSFDRNFLPGGVYFFKISDEKGRYFSGKILISD